jgi:glycosyltransferase involved in cell wall biosynthesis
MFLSVIICTYNRDQHIKRALDSLTAQDFDKNRYEIIVVDNNSTDKTSEIINRFKEEHPEHQIVLTTEKNQGLSFARNKGISLAKGKIISYIDDDGIAKKDYIKQIEEYIVRYPNHYAFGGKVLAVYETKKTPDWMSKYIERIISIVDLGEEVKILKKTYPVGCNMFFKKEIFEKLGGFNTQLKLRSDDKYIFLKIRQAGYEILYLPKVVVWHYIDAFRITGEYVKKVSKLNGEAEYTRINSLNKNRKKLLFFRLSDYIFKIGASSILWIGFTLKGQSIKGKMLFLSMWYSLKGFLSSKK